MKFTLGRKTAALAVAGVVMAGAGTMAWADSSAGPATAPTTTAPAGTAPAAAAKKAGGRAGGGLGILGRADHGDIEVKVKATGAWQTVTFDKGQVSDVAADHITLARPDGKSVTLTINSATKYRGVTSWQGVSKAKVAVVTSVNGTATAVAQRA